MQTAISMGHKLWIIMVCAFAMVALAVHAQNLVVNGSFEQVSPPVGPNKSNNGLSPTAGVPGWASSAIGLNFFEVWCNTVNGIPTLAGTNQLEINAQSADQTVSQVVTNLTIGRPTTFCFDYTGRNGAAGDPPTPNNDFTVALSGGVTIGPVSMDPAAYTAAGGWQNFCTNFIPTTSTVSITFRGRPHVTVASGTHIDNVSLTQSPRPTVTIEPDGQTVCVGQNVTFTASGEGSYAWNGPNGFTASTAAITLTKVTAAMAGRYTVIVTGAGGGTATATVTLSVSALPVAAIAAGERTVCAGQDVTFTASGGTSYVWTGPGGFTASTAAITLTKVTSAMAGRYTVIVTGVGGCTATANATLTVSALPEVVCPTTVTTNISGNSVVVHFANPIVAGGTLQSCVPTNGSVFGLGTTLVTCIATNDCGTNICTFNVTVTNGDQGTAPCDRTNTGQDFWLTFIGNYAPDPNDQPNITLCIVGSVGTTGLVTIPGLPVPFSAGFTIPPPAVGAIGSTTVTLPRDAHLDNLNDQIAARGVHVTASMDVSVTGMNYLKFTSESFLALPTTMLGGEYAVLGYGNVQNDVTALNGSQFALVASENGTQVTITPSVTTLSHLGGVPYTIVLNQGEVYQLRNTNAAADLSGSIITASRPVSVFGGHRCANIQSPSTFFCNTLVEQLLPVAHWGTNFATLPLATRDNYTLKVVAARDNTLVTTNGSLASVLNRGSVFEWVANGPVLITADQPVFVAEYSNSANFDQRINADPFMVTALPVTLFGKNHTFCVPTNGFPSNYVNIVVNGTSVPNVQLDGVSINQSVVLNTYPNIGSGSLSGIQVQVTPGVHTLSSSFPFTAIVYGYAEYDAYANLAGIGPGCSPKCLSISCPSNIVVFAKEGIEQRVAFQVAATNSCGGEMVVSCNPASGSVFPFGTTVVQCEAGDPTGRSGGAVRCSFSVTVARAPKISTVALIGDNFTFSLLTESGATLYVESTTSVASNQWILLRTVVGDGSVVTVTDPVAVDARFYRVRKE